MKVKISIVLVSLALLISSYHSLYGQDSSSLINNKQDRYLTHIELLGGPSWSLLRGNPSVDNNSINSRSFKLGYSIGFELTHPINKRIQLTGMFLVENKGGMSSHTSLYFDDASQTYKEGKVTEEYKYDYRTVNFVVNYSLGKKSLFKVGLGPYVSYLESQIVETTHITLGSKGIEDQISFDKRWDAGCAIRFSYLIPIGQNIGFQIQILNHLGLVNTRADPNYGIIKTNNTNVLIGFLIKR